MKFNKSKKFFAGLMASLFISGVLIKPHALNPEAGDYATAFKKLTKMTAFKKLTKMGDDYNSKYVFPQSIKDLNNETFVQAQEAAQKITSYPLCYEGLCTSPLRTTTDVPAKKLQQACLMYELNALIKNLKDIQDKTALPLSQQKQDWLDKTKDLLRTVKNAYDGSPMPVLNEFWYMLLSQLAAIHSYLIHTGSDLSTVCGERLNYEPHTWDVDLASRLLNSTTETCPWILFRLTTYDEGRENLRGVAELIDDLYNNLFRAKTVRELTYALNPKAGDYATVFKNLTEMGDDYNGKYVFPQSIEDLNNETFVQAQEAAQKITSYPLCYEGLCTSPLRTTTDVPAKKLQQACLMYELNALIKNLKDIQDKTALPLSQQKQDWLDKTKDLLRTVKNAYDGSPMPVLNEFWYMLLSQLAAIHSYLINTGSDLSTVCGKHLPYRTDTKAVGLADCLLNSINKNCPWILRKLTTHDEGRKNLRVVARLIDDLYNNLFRAKTVLELTSVQ